ncbi:MAG: transaldolase [Acutalibacter sp.]|nr:transaldolase [Acutalibacter sp.]
MSQYLGKLHECAEKFPQTEIWMDSCGEEELNYGLARGISGATSNPVIVGAVVKKEIDLWEPKIQELIRKIPDATEDEIVWALIDEIGALRSKKLLSIFRAYHGKRGRMSIQTNAKYYRSSEKILAQAVHINSLGENIQVKIPASAAGIQAMEEATYRGISINATVSFTVAQAVAVAEAVERGLKRREREGLDISSMSPVCTLMIGRTDDWMKDYVSHAGMIINPECLEWAGIAVMKKAYGIYRERGYRTKLLSAANRNVYHWSELIGGDLAQTINYSWYTRLDRCDMEIRDQMDCPVAEEHLKQLEKIPEFRKVINEDGLTPNEFEKCHGFCATISGFIAGYEDLCGLIRAYMAPQNWVE